MLFWAKYTEGHFNQSRATEAGHCLDSDVAERLQVCALNCSHQNNECVVVSSMSHLAHFCSRNWFDDKIEVNAHDGTRSGLGTRLA